jgi:hypothetical protein
MDKPNDYNGGELVVVSVTFLALTYMSVLLRCFVRIQITRSFSADDWFMVIAQVNPPAHVPFGKGKLITV